MGIEFVCDQGQNRATQEDQRADQVGISTAGLVFGPTGVAVPVVTNLHPGPVAPNEDQPGLRRALVHLQAAEKVSCFFRPLTASVRLFAYRDHGSGIRDIGLQRLDGHQRQFAVLDPSVSLLGAGKRGEATEESFWARRNRAGWFPLSCSR